MEAEMSVGNAWKYRPERQARIQQDMQNPEYMRRREMWKKADRKKRGWVARWNREWNAAGRPASFPDFAEWKAAVRPTLSELEIVMIER
jgi:hypothetical protein